jgi:pimeloyl-ACP methyl ester carboxylesterase
MEKIPMTRPTYMELDYNNSHLRVSTKFRPAGDHLIVFMHGFGCAKECFDPAFSLEEFRDYSICTFDFPGHGHSAKTGISAYALQSYADMTNLLIDRLPHGKVSLVCHSMGGAIGLIATQERRDLGALISVDGNLVAQDCGIVSRDTASQSLAKFKREGFKRFLEHLQESQDADERAWAGWYAQSDPCALHESARSLVEWSDNGKLLDLFRSLPAKAYIYGANEPKGYLLPELGGLATFAIPKAGHFVMLDNPGAFYSVLAQILNGRMGAAAEGPPTQRVSGF